MSVPFRRIFDDEMAVKAIQETIWQCNQRQKQGLSNFGIFSRVSVSTSKEEASHDEVNINPLNKR